MFATAKNTTAGPLPVDDEGRTLGGGEWGTVETTAEAVRRAVDAGELVVLRHDDDLPEDAAADVRTAHAATARLEHRRRYFGDLAKEDLVDHARGVGLVAHDADDAEVPTKGELVRQLVRANAVPEADPAPDEPVVADAIETPEPLGEVADDVAPTPPTTTSTRRRGARSTEA